MLLAREQRRKSEGSLRWLDLMAGCGIRGLRWVLEAAMVSPSSISLHVNDADPDRLPLLNNNLQSLSIPLQITSMPAAMLLARSFLDGCHFDLIDMDAFGAPGCLIQPALQALRFNGILLLSSTDGRSPTGHDRSGAIRSLGSAARAHPSSWEMALRQQIGLVARQAWMLGMGVQPLVSFSEGRTFRVCLRLRQQLTADEETCLGLIARCEGCGAQAAQPLLRLKDWSPCRCAAGDRRWISRWIISGPLWIGPLQDPVTLDALLADAFSSSEDRITPETRRLLQRLRDDPGVPATVWSTDELSSRLAASGPPPLRKLQRALHAEGYAAVPSGVMPGQLRTDADLSVLLQICSGIERKEI